MSHHSAAARRCGGFAAVGPAARRYRDRSLHGRRSAAVACGAGMRAVPRRQRTHKAERRPVSPRAALSIWWALRTSPCRGPYARAYRAYRLMRPWQHQKSRTSCPSAETLLLASHVTLLDFVIFFNYLPLIWIRSTGCKSNCDPADTDPGTNEPTSAAEWRVSARYDGAVPIRQRYART